MIALSDLAYASLIALGIGDLFAFYVFFPFFYVPRLMKAFLTALPQLVLNGLTQLGTNQKMSELGKKGVEARQEKAENQALIAMVSTEDPLKGIVSELVPALMGGVATDLPAYVRKGIEARVQKAIIASPMNLTNAVAPPVIKWLDERVTQLSGGKVHLAEELKALGVLSTAEKVASE